MSDLIKPKILIFIIATILISTALTAYIMRNVYKPRASSYCSGSLSSINYRTTCTAYQAADYLCSNGVKGTVGDGTCQLSITLLQQAQDACCNPLTPTRRPLATPKPPPGRPPKPLPTTPIE